MTGGKQTWLIAAGFLWASAATAEGPSPLSTYVLMTGSGPVARAVMADDDACPALMVDGRHVAMTMRAEPADLPLRPTKSAPENSKPSRFPVRVCEAPVPATARTVRIGHRALPVPHRIVRRIVVIGDTGCRIKASDNAYQACDDPQAWPFARIAAQAAAWKPDLVLHVGDYLYRENPCAGHAGCTNSPWGYGWDAWDADFFTPAAPLLAAAPWVMVRGNHESCLRAGQGWWRLLAAQPVEAGRDCNDPAYDVQGDDSPPFAVPLGGGAQIIAMDLAIMGEDAIPAGDPRYAQIRSIQQAVMKMAKDHRFTFATDHYPLLGLTACLEMRLSAHSGTGPLPHPATHRILPLGGRVGERAGAASKCALPRISKQAAKQGTLRIKAGYEAVRSTFGITDPALHLRGIDALIAGHVHEWQQVDLGPAHPSQFISGMAGTQEDVTEVPANRAPGQEPAPGAKVRRFGSWTGGFGFMTLERLAVRRWRVEVHGLDGQIIRRCTIHGRRSACTA